MNFLTLILAAIAPLAAVQAFDSIDHDQVHPFAQPVPATDAEAAAVKYKPQLHITDGCHPYPAVQADGSVSGGLEWSGADDGDCKGSAWGSQVYARSAWYNNKYAIMYAWYFPKGKGRQHVHKLHSGHRHEWEFAVVWVDQPSADHSNLLGVSMSFGPSFHKEAPVQPEHVVGSSIKLDSYSTFWGAKQGLRVTTDIGTTQDLIQWEQLTDAARASLTETNFDIDEAVVPVEMPLKDDVFQLKLNSTYPF
ncbi:necrosis inducing-like protein NPP1 type [Phytophthora cinnamomi]|uniref:necrosis inducing-like protein NPP1 type n=1 Tax=Phytophthora cinnamomi TaxID=4785 RepID=UPI00355AC5E9|nr:necrosis inducing-like protein NPP1 type [Phytophthora cinnamomi]KAG6614743.1 necrosis inducing-like protein NPP1 type [Phytophthora cinnamomi]